MAKLLIDEINEKYLRDVEEDQPEGWYADIDGNGNTRLYNLETDEEGPIISSREDLERMMFNGF